MKNGVEIIPTVVPATLDDVRHARERYASFSSALHIDAADGAFAPNTTWMPAPGDTLPDADSFFYEAHLMIEKPLGIGVAFARAGAARIIAHIEAFEHAEQAREVFSMWKQAGAGEVGLGVLMATPAEALAPYAGICDSLLLMTIATIGVQGLPFDEESVVRVKAIHKAYPSLVLGVDGGISDANIKRLARAGASRFCVGSALMKSHNPEETYASLTAAVS